MEMKIKVLATVAALLTMSSTSLFAKTNFCHYSDYFHLGEDSPAGIHLLNFATDDNIVFKPFSETSFYLNDVSSCPREGGTATVRYGDETHFCTLAIHDGAYEMHPKVVAVECDGLSYSDLTYDGVLTYKYTLHFRK